MKTNIIKECLLKKKFVLLLYCLLALILEASQIAIAYVLQRVINLVENYSLNELVFIIVLVLATTLTFFLSSFLVSLVESKLIQSFKDELYNNIYNHVLNLDFNNFNKHDNSFYVSLTINDVPSLVNNYL